MFVQSSRAIIFTVGVVPAKTVPVKWEDIRFATIIVMKTLCLVRKSIAKTTTVLCILCDQTKRS